MKISETESLKNHKKQRRNIKIIPIAAVLAAILVLSVSAYGFIRSDFYKNAFGTGIEGSQGGLKSEYDADGNLIKTYDAPSVERIDVDPELAEALIGDCVANALRTQTLGEYTVKVGEYVFDENGIGMVSAVISHPQGHSKYNGEWYLNTDKAFSDYESFVYAGDKELKFPFLDYKSQVAKRDSTETDFHVIYYVCPMSEEQEKADIDYVFHVPSALAKDITKDTMNSGGSSYSGDELYDSVTIRLCPDKRVAAEDFVCGDCRISVSPLGAKLPLGRIERTGEDGSVWYEAREPVSFVIKYADGTEYIVNDSEHVSNGVGTLDADNGVVRVAFNRLVDIGNIESISITAQDNTVYSFTADK